MKLFEPLQLGNMHLNNRIVMAPLTRNRAAAGGVPQAMNVEYYRQRASAGLIVSEASPISPQGIGYPGTPCIYSAAQVAGWREVVAAVHAAGGHMFLQLWHVGRISHPSLQADGQPPVAPSAIRPAGEAITHEGMQPFVTPRALAEEELPEIVQHYVRASRNALEAGFDGCAAAGQRGRRARVQRVDNTDRDMVALR